MRSNGVALPGDKPRLIGSRSCHGVALDLPRRRYPFLGCNPTIRRNEAADRQVRAAPAWAGWDAGLARAGREELGEVVPAARPAIEPFPVSPSPLADLLLGHRD